MVSTGQADIFDYPLRIRFRGTYDYDGLLDMIRGYYASHLFDVKETKFKFKTKNSLSEVEFKMEADRKVTHYIKVFMYVEGKLWDVKREEHVIDGVKRVLTNGRLDIKVYGKWELDYANKFGVDSPKDGKVDKVQKRIERWMQDVLDNPQTGLQFGDTKLSGKKYMEKTLVALADKIKTFLGMVTMR